MVKNKEVEVPSINLLSSGTVVKGEIKLDGDFRLDGQNADFSGEVKATVKVSELLTLKETAKYRGDITTNKLSIEPGAKFSGNCIMEGSGIKGNVPPPVKQDEFRPKETTA